MKLLNSNKLPKFAVFPNFKNKKILKFFKTCIKFDKIDRIFETTKWNEIDEFEKINNMPQNCEMKCFKFNKNL